MPLKNGESKKVLISSILELLHNYKLEVQKNWPVKVGETT